MSAVLEGWRRVERARGVLGSENGRYEVQQGVYVVKSWGGAFMCQE